VKQSSINPNCHCAKLHRLNIIVRQAETSNLVKKLFLLKVVEANTSKSVIQEKYSEFCKKKEKREKSLKVKAMLCSIDANLAEICRKNLKIDRESSINKTIGENHMIVN